MTKRMLLSLVLVVAMLLPASAAAVANAPNPPVVTPGSLSTATIKAGMKTRNLGSTATGYDVALGTDTDFQPPSTPPAGFVLYDSGATYPWVNGGANPISFLYDTTKLDATFPINAGAGTGNLTWASGNLGLLNYLEVAVVCRRAGTTVSFTGVTVNGQPLPDFIPPSCGTGTDWYTWYVTGIDMTAGFNIAGSLNLTGAPGSGQETNKVEIKVGAIPALAATTADSLICTGETTTVSIDLAEVTGLYGYQFEVSYDQGKASAAGAFVNSFFDTTTNAVIPPGWNADCTTTPGTCKFAVSKQAPGTAVSGSGSLAQIVLTGVAPGTFTMAISNDVLSNIDGAALPHSLSAPLPITVCGYATISGFITLQGRPGNNVDTGTVSMIEQAPVYFAPAAPVSFSATDGAYSIVVPYMPGGSSYKILAEHGLYLDNEDIITVAANLANKNTRLWGGDANNDGDVTIADLSCIGGDFGSQPPTSTCSGTGSPDINADGKVNIQDLSIAGGNFDKCDAQPWAWQTATPVYCPP